MPVIIKPVVGRGFQVNESPGNERQYYALGATSEAECYGALLSYLQGLLGSSMSLNGLTLKNISGAEQVKNGYKCSVSWGAFQRKEPLRVNESSFHFEVAVAPVKVVVPLSQQVYKRTSDTNPLPTSIHLIGDQGDGNGPQGVDVFEPEHSESETHIFPASFITPMYKQTIKRIVGKVNTAPFKGHAAGEVLMQGVSGERRGTDDWSLTFRWSVRENIYNETVAGIAIPQRNGWDYLWPVHELGMDDSGAPKVSSLIKYLVVSQVLRRTDFGPLMIGIS